MKQPAAFPRLIQPADSRSAASERSREVDALLDDLDVVLGCRCCAPRAFIIEDWAADEDEPAEPFRLLQ
jgi:hypothetical protein